MNVEGLPDLNPPPFGELRDAQRPILSFAWHKADAHRAAAHRHPRAHIIQPTAGAYWVVTPEGRWLVPAGQAIWVPPEVHHEVFSLGAVSARMLFVDPAWAAALPTRCGTVAVSPLLTELIVRALEHGNDYPPDGPAARLARVLLDELAAMRVAPLLVPIGQDPRLARAMGRLVDDPGSPVGLDELAENTGASARTLARLFRDQTGMTFTQWRTRLRLVESIERLARGESVTEVALDLGYSSPSSFAYAFRRHLGEPPHSYRDRVAGNMAPTRVT
jgi:AraC-like DNA-binding protein